MDIATNGLIEPIWVYGDQIIDGRNRYKACQATGTAIRVKEWNGKGSLVGFVVSLNLNRRQLSPSQKAAVALEMLPMLEAEAKERQVQAGKETHGHRHSTGTVQLLPPVGEAVEPAQPSSTRTAAEILGVSHGNISEMKRIARVAPEKVDEIRAGVATIQFTCALKIAREINRLALTCPSAVWYRYSCDWHTPILF